MPVDHTFAIAGAKGGVGKTTNSLNLGTALAIEGYETVVVEADLAMANVVDFLDVNVNIERDPTLHDVLAGDSGVFDAVYDAPDGIDLLPSGVDLRGYAAADPEGMEAVVEALRSAYEVIVLDTGAGLNAETLYPMGIADETIVTSTPRVASVRDVEKTIELAEQAGGDVRGIVFTKSGTGQAPPVERIAEFLDVDLLGHVPEDDAVPTSQDAGRTVTARAPESDAAEAYREIAATLDEEIDPSRPVLSAEPAGGSSGRNDMSELLPREDSPDEDERMVLTDTTATDGGEPGVERVDPTAATDDTVPDSPEGPEPTSGESGDSAPATGVGSDGSNPGAGRSMADEPDGNGVAGRPDGGQADDHPGPGGEGVPSDSERGDETGTGADDPDARDGDDAGEGARDEDESGNSASLLVRIKGVFGR